MTTLVLLPGMDGTGELFAPLLAELDPRLKTVVIRYPRSAHLGYQELVSFVRNALPADDEFVILGESFSGPIAVSLAAQAPSGLRGLILCASFLRCPLPWPALLKPLARLLPLGALPTSILSVPLLVFMSYVLSFIYVGIYWNKLQYANHPSSSWRTCI